MEAEDAEGVEEETDFEEIDMDALARKTAGRTQVEGDAPIAQTGVATSPYIAASSHIAQTAAATYRGRFASRRCVSQASQTETVQWNVWDPTRWLHVLQEAGCDQLAQDTFMNMAQLPRAEASYHANQIVSYLRAKTIRDASRLVHRWALDADRKVKTKLSWEVPP